MNEIILVGRLGDDPSFKELKNDKAICSFSIATNKKKGKDGEKKEITEWHTIVAFDDLARKVNKYLKKGIQVCIVGEISTRSYQPKGKDFTIPKTEVLAKQISVTLYGLENLTK
jgi:single-strand DNA-binding protein